MAGVENVTSSWMNATPPSVDERFATKTVELAIVRYLFPIVVFVGTAGNLTSVAVLLRPRMRNRSVYVFLLLLAFADTAVLYMSAFKTWIRVISGFELLTVSRAACPIVSFTVLVAQHMAAWIVVLVTIDRFIAVWFPLRATSWCTVARACTAFVICLLAVCLYNGHLFWTMEVGPGGRRCLAKMVDGHVIWFMAGPFHYLKFVTYCLLPFVAILCINVLIVVRLRWTPASLRPGFAVINSTVSTAGLQDAASSVAMATEEGVANERGGASRMAYSATVATASRQEQQSRVTYMLLAVSTTWLLLTAPYALFTLAVHKLSDDPETRAAQRMVKSFCFLLMYVNHAVNFFLYCLTGRKFRQELRDMLTSVFSRRATRRWISTSPSMRTTRSNCVELEPLNNDSQRAAGPGSTRGGSARRAFFVGDPGNEVVVVAGKQQQQPQPPRYRDVVDDEAAECNDGTH